MPSTAQKVTASLVTVAVILVILVKAKELLIPFALSVIIWYIIDAMSVQIAHIRLGKGYPFRRFSLLISLLIIGLLFSGLFHVIGGTIEQVNATSSQYSDNVSRILDRLSSLFGVEVAPFLKHWADNLNIGRIIGSFASAIMGIASNAGLVALYVAFLLLEKRYFGIKMALIVPDEQRRSRVQNILTDIQNQIRRYLLIKTLVSALTGILSYAVLLWVEVDYAEFWALLIFMLNYIPVIGSLIAVLMPTALALVQFDSFAPFLILLVGLGGLQLVIGNVVEPKIMGSSLNLSPLVVILSLSLWGEIWGVTGMFLSVPIAVISMIVMSHIPAMRPFAIAMSETGVLYDDSP